LSKHLILKKLPLYEILYLHDYFKIYLGEQHFPLLDPEEIVREVKALGFSKDSVLAEHSSAFSDWDAMHVMGFGQDNLPERSHTIRDCLLFRGLFGGVNKKGYTQSPKPLRHVLSLSREVDFS